MSTRINWCRDEIILAMDYYFQNRDSNFDTGDDGVVALQKTIFDLPVIPQWERPENFRNLNGVSMKLLNIRSVDPSSTTEGLAAGGRLERELFHCYVDRQDELTAIASGIRTNVLELDETALLRDENSDEFPEGLILYSTHRIYEMNIRGKHPARLILSNRCHVCGFDAVACIHEDGHAIMERHEFHFPSEISWNTNPIIASVCANCHKYLHQHRPWLSQTEAHSQLFQR